MSQASIPKPSSLNLDNIQGDILSGLPKKTQTYFFFQITNVKLFRAQLVQFAPLVKTVAQVLKDRKAIDDHKKKGNKTLLKMTGVNIAFSHKGFVQMGIDDSTLTSDSNFEIGQRADAESLGDKGSGTGADFVPDWDPAFLQDIHGVILISGDSHESVNQKLKEVKKVFGVGSINVSIKEVISTSGDVRPGEQSGHEHFGFLDGISNPSVIGFDTNPLPGPPQIQPGALIMGHEGDVPNRAAWAVDGSFLAFRYLFQDVLGFDNFLKEHPVPMPGLTPEEGSELLGARMVGRWKSGAPIDLSPFQDDPDLAKDPQRINNFRFAGESGFQKICPFAAHIRKTLPRADLEDLNSPPNSLQKNRITRRGVQFGPEVTKEERSQGKTIHGRGLLFACYQTSLNTGFAFLQKSWANTADFPPEKGSPQLPGLDPLIGQGDRTMTGTDPSNPNAPLSMPDFIVPRGGEYFFSPSLKGLRETLAVA